MLLSSVLLAALTASVTASPTLFLPALSKRQDQNATETNVTTITDLEEFITTEREIALAGVLANIGGLNSSLVEGASPGVVVASPSTVNPNYFYTWTRDSALTYIMIIDEYLLGDGNDTLNGTIYDYIQAQAQLQTVTNPSGTLYPAGLGLGEAKFYTNLTRFDGTWGRPQNDGPALRAVALMNFGASLIEANESNADVIRENVWPIILNDLQYVGQYWNTTAYDLWEEVHGNSFFTHVAQHRALVQGQLMAELLGEECGPCNQSEQLLCFLQNNFWNETGNYILADINVNNANRSGINADPILAAMHAFDINATCDSALLQPCNSQVLATHKVLVDSFRNLYEINANATAPDPVLVGRYPEDTYYGGNPWPICTLAMAEVLYDAIGQWEAAGEISVDSVSLPFFQDVYNNTEIAVYVGEAMEILINATRDYADSFISVMQPYLPANGSISEQFNRTTGESLSASKLTWSFAAFVTAAQRRAGEFPASWGANSSLANTNVTECAASSYNATGNYTAVTVYGADEVDTSCVGHVIFTVNASTVFGTNIYLVGNTSLLGGQLQNSSASNVILPMNPGNFTSQRPEWYVDIYLPAGETVEYQYALQYPNVTYVFENVSRTIQVPECGSQDVIVTNDAAQLPLNEES